MKLTIGPGYGRPNGDDGSRCAVRRRREVFWLLSSRPLSGRRVARPLLNCGHKSRGPRVRGEASRSSDSPGSIGVARPTDLGAQKV